MMRFKNRKKDINCVKIGVCGRDPKIKCVDCRSYKEKLPEPYNKSTIGKGWFPEREKE